MTLRERLAAKRLESQQTSESDMLTPAQVGAVVKSMEDSPVWCCSLCGINVVEKSGDVCPSCVKRPCTRCNALTIAVDTAGSPCCVHCLAAAVDKLPVSTIIKGPTPKPGLVLTGSPAQEPAGMAGTSMVEGRQLGYENPGENTPMKFVTDGLHPDWARLAHCYATELCIAVHPMYGRAWLAIRPKEYEHGALLIHQLPVITLADDEIPF